MVLKSSVSRYDKAYYTLLHASVQMEGKQVRQKSHDDLVHVSAYIPKSLYAKIVAMSEKERRSISSEVVILLERALEDSETK
jgi:hypothetical protein